MNGREESAITSFKISDIKNGNLSWFGAANVPILITFILENKRVCFVSCWYIVWIALKKFISAYRFFFQKSFKIFFQRKVLKIESISYVNVFLRIWTKWYWPLKSSSIQSDSILISSKQPVCIAVWSSKPSFVPISMKSWTSTKELF